MIDRGQYHRQRRLPPSIRANRQLELRIAKELCSSQFVYEYVEARRDKGFSPVMVGQKVMLEWLSQLAPTTTQVGWQTAQIRTHLELEIELEKQKSCKSDAIPATHAVDGVALAYSQFVSYQAFQSATSRGHYWVSRRQLHLMVPAKKGVHRKYSGTITQHGFRKGDYVKAEMARRVYYGWVSGDTKTQVSVSDLNWKRLGQFAKSKIQLIRQATGLVVTGAKAPVSVSSRL